MCESIRYQAKSEQNVRQDLIPRVGHGEAAARLKTPSPFAVSFGIHRIAGEPKSVKSIKSGLLIEVRKQAHAENLFKTTTFVEWVSDIQV